MSIDWYLETYYDEVIKLQDIPKDISVEEIKKNTQQPIQLTDIISKFISPENVPNTWCSQCKKQLNQTKRLALFRLPPFLIIHLKRYKEK